MANHERGDKLKITIDMIDPDPKQPRKNITGIDELVTSIKKKGLLQPITLRPAGDRYIIVIGERRFRAAKLAGLTEIEANIKDISEREAFELAIIENVQRQDLTPIEEAKAFEQLQAQGMTQEAIAQTIGKGQSYVAHKLRLLKLPEMVRAGLDEGKISEGHARQIARIESQSDQERAYSIITDRALSVRDAVDLAGEFCNKKEIQEQVAKQSEIPPDIDLLKAQGIKPPNSWIWVTSISDLCGNRNFSIYARFMYLIGRQYSEHVYSLGMSGRNSIDLEMAIFNMRRKQAESIDQADLIFVDLVAGNQDFEELHNTTEDAFIVVRSGPPQRTINHDANSIIKAAEFMCKYGIKLGPRFVCELPEIPEEEALIIQAKENKTVINSFDDWVVGCMSRDIVCFNMAGIAEFTEETSTRKGNH